MIVSLILTFSLILQIILSVKFNLKLLEFNIVDICNKSDSVFIPFHYILHQQTLESIQSGKNLDIFII